jgi:hypothetical protein
MAFTRRSALILLLLGSFLLIGVIFRAFFLEVVVKPVALLVWLLWRTVQSVDQRAYWGILIGFAIVYAFVRLARRLTDVPDAPQPDSNVTLDKINQWRMLIPLFSDDIGEPNILKDNLGRMLAAIYNSRQPEAAHWEVDEALRERRIPLPETIYTFLFPPEPQEYGSAFRRFLQTLRDAPEKWARSLAGRDTAEYHHSIEEVLAYMESLMEKKS